MARLSDADLKQVRVSVFGSCRQDSLYSLFSVDPIREALTYPHYPLEARQAIAFCKGTRDLDEASAAIAFRYSLLHKRPVDRETLRRAYAASDLVCIEIASRITYMYNDVACHHIVVDEKYGVPQRAEIVVRDATDAEIEADIVAIKNLLAPKPFWITSHFYSRDSGKRYDLVRLLEAICARHAIPFLDPVRYTATFTPSLIYEPEAVLSHYTPFGHDVARQVYLDFVLTHFRPHLEAIAASRGLWKKTLARRLLPRSMRPKARY